MQEKHSTRVKTPGPADPPRRPEGPDSRLTRGEPCRRVARRPAGLGGLASLAPAGCHSSARMYGNADIDSATRRVVAPPRALAEGRYPGMRDTSRARPRALTCPPDCASISRRHLR